MIVAVGLLYLAESVELGFKPAAVLASTGSLAAAATTRPLYWLAAVFAAGTVYFGLTRRGAALHRRARRAAGLVCVLPAVLLVASAVRQSVLSGYPFFPLTFPALPVGWRVPASVVQDQTRWDFAWARSPGILPSIVLSSWHWLTAVWLHSRERDLDVVAPLALLASLVPSFAARGGPGGARKKRALPMLAVLVPSVVTLVAWFFLAPDPRFAFAPIWVVPIAVTAWVLPPFGNRRSLIVAALVAPPVAAGLATVSIKHPAWFLPVALEVWAGVAIAACLVTRSRSPALVAHAAALSVALAAIGVVVHRGGFHPVVANQSGPLGTPPETVPQVAAVETASGLKVLLPQGTDQCWKVLLCVPQLRSPSLRLRGTTIRAGFRMTS